MGFKQHFTRDLTFPFLLGRWKNFVAKISLAFLKARLLGLLASLLYALSLRFALLSRESIVSRVRPS